MIYHTNIIILDLTYIPHVSRHKLDRKTENELLQSFETVLAKIGKRTEMNMFLFSLLSDTERIMLGKRLGVVLLLKDNVSETVIAEVLHITRQTAYRIKQSAEFKNSGYNVALKALKRDKQIQEFKKMLLGLARYSVRAAGGRATLLNK